MLFDEPTRSTFVIPALADYQQELGEAGASAIKRLTAHVRGYAAFARLVLAAPFIVPSAPMGSPVTTFVTGKYGGNLLLVLALALFAAIRPLFGWFAVAVIGLGIALAIALRIVEQPSPERARRRGRSAAVAAGRDAVRRDLVDVRLVRAGGGRRRRHHGDRLAALEHASSK